MNSQVFNDVLLVTRGWVHLEGSCYSHISHKCRARLPAFVLYCTCIGGSAFVILMHFFTVQVSYTPRCSQYVVYMYTLVRSICAWFIHLGAVNMWFIHLGAVNLWFIHLGAVNMWFIHLGAVNMWFIPYSRGDRKLFWKGGTNLHQCE